MISPLGALSSFQALVSDQPDGEAGKSGQKADNSSVLLLRHSHQLLRGSHPEAPSVRSCEPTQKPTDQSHAGLASVVLGTAASEWKIREDLYCVGLHAPSRESPQDPTDAKLEVKQLKQDQLYSSCHLAALSSSRNTATCQDLPTPARSIRAPPGGATDQDSLKRTKHWQSCVQGLS